MAAVHPSNPRASLLSGLRTGGVRSSSGPMHPYSATPGGSFHAPRFASNNQYQPPFSEEEEDQISDMYSQKQYSNVGFNRPMTAAVDGNNNRFQSQQTSRMNANSPPFVPGFAAAAPQTPSAQQQAQTMHEMQMLQMEVMRLQAVQAQQQQYQAGVQANYLAELVRQQMNSIPQGRRASVGYNPPATAGPLNSNFDLRSATLRRANQAEQLKAQLGLTNEDNVPMTAAVGGKFGNRSVSMTPPRFAAEVVDQNTPPTPGYTTVISGGTPLGTPTFATSNASTNAASGHSTPSKSDSAVSWRRGGNNNSVLSGNRAVSLAGSPTVRITPPPTERDSPPPGLTALKARPLPLHFNRDPSHPMPVVTIDTSVDGIEAIEVELPGSSGSSTRSSSSLSPTTPPSSASMEIPLSPREEAAKKLYEGLGIGRPAPLQAPPVVSLRMASQPLRQPRGPPSGADELGPKNFATRIRRKAIGGLGVLMGARERREAVEAF